MITLFKQTSRADALEYIRTKYPDHEIVYIEDTIDDSSRIVGEISAVDLFGRPRAIFINNAPRDDWDSVIDALEYIPSTTTVFWSEDSFPVAYTKKIPKHTVVEGQKKTPSENKSNPFQIANQLSSPITKDIWKTYRILIDEGNAPEALFGIVWWKLKDIAKRNKKLSLEFKKTLHTFLNTYSTARETGGDLETGLEQVLLTLTKKDLV